MTTVRDLSVAAILAAGVALAGFFVAQGFMGARSADRYVTVKGISERDVQADVAIWPLRVVASDNDLGRAHAQIEAAMAQIRAFLAKHEIDATGAQVSGFSVTDAQANQYRSGDGGNRFVINRTLVVRSAEPAKVFAASAKVGELVAAGVVLSSGGEYGGGGPTFIFTRLSELKPEMIAEATGRAREAAEQFARDSGSRIGGIRRANQGMFEILPRDRAQGITEEGQLAKTVRVVSTVDYRLE
ncbi:MAG: SIMPL domain-containing protein [Myxococcota bacterium]